MRRRRGWRDPDDYGDPGDNAHTATARALGGGDNVIVDITEITNRRPNGDPRLAGICVEMDGPSNDNILRNTTVHACGELPGNNHEHCIYVGGDNNEIRDNICYDSPARGLQLYEDGDNNLIEGNIFSDNEDAAIHFSGSGAQASANNEVFGNVLAFGLSQWNVNTNEAQITLNPPFPSSGSADRNEVYNNCAWTALNVADNSDGSGFEPPQDPADYYFVPAQGAANANVVENPQFFNRAADDYRIRAGTACAAKYTGPQSNLYTPTGS